MESLRVSSSGESSHINMESLKLSERRASDTSNRPLYSFGAGLSAALRSDIGGWAGWGEGQYQVHKRWLSEIDPSGGLLRQYQQAPEAGMDFEGHCSDGQATAVTGQNLQWFVLFKVQEQLFGEGRQGAVRAFGAGLGSLGTDALGALKALPEHELMLRVEGQRNITGKMLLLAMRVEGAIAEEAQWLERVVVGMGGDLVLLLLRFATSHVRLMLDGLPRENSARGRRISMRFGHDVPVQGFPRAHTCSYEVDLPHYRSEAELRERLVAAVSADMAMGIG